jgi:hypothetical protein
MTNEKCARTVCNKPHDNCTHRDTGLKYCNSCAIRINRANDDMQLIHIPKLAEHKNLRL